MKFWLLIKFWQFHNVKARIYIDTSVLGGYFDPEFENPTKKLFERIKNSDFSIYFSEVNETELFLAPQQVKELVKTIPADCYKHIDLDDESKTLAETYIKEKALGQASLNDAYHIALASVNRLDCLVSWNFKHIVNFDKIKLFNSINIKLGYPLIDLRTSLEFLKDED